MSAGEPREVPPAEPAQPSQPPHGVPLPGSQPDIPAPVREPAAPPAPQELPGRTPDEMPPRGPSGPRTPYPATDAGIDERPGSEPDVVGPGAALPQGAM